VASREQFLCTDGGGILAGVSGSNFLTSQAQAQGYQAATQQTAAAAEDLVSIAQLSSLTESITAGVVRGTAEASTAPEPQEPTDVLKTSTSTTDDEGVHGRD
jgi:hypothetical protein